MKKKDLPKQIKSLLFAEHKIARLFRVLKHLLFLKAITQFNLLDCRLNINLLFQLHHSFPAK